MNNLICIGKNYLDHAKELGDVIPTAPVIFLKPYSILVAATNSKIPLKVTLPKNHGPVHFECELVFKLNADGNPQAFTLGLDLTLRDLQAELKKKGHPWELSKVFPNSAIIGPWQPLESTIESDIQNIMGTEFQFVLDGQLKQIAKGKEMRFSPSTCISFVQEHFPISEGDLLFTGTPSGVGPLLPGQKAELIWNGKRLYEVEFL